jgi:hypothetical protein
MKFASSRTAIACATALVIAGCGGSSTSSDANTPNNDNNTTTLSALKLSGTAATGAALSSGSVTVKCASGTGTATTGTNGDYTVTITGGALPCMIEVTGTVNGTEVTLHSVTEAGTTSGGDVNAVANITPLTEMIVAKLAGALPADLFASFSSGNQITSEQLSAATTAVVTALKDATGIDLGTIDPFKTTLVAATPTAPTAGNDYDKLLDALAEKVSTEALPLVVNQIANATDTTTETSVTLTDVMAGVNSGSLAGCAAAVSGKYRTLDYFGRTAVRQLDFKNLAWNTGDGQQKMYTIAPHGTESCRFTASGTFNGVEANYDVVIGPSGAGTYRLNNLTSGRSVAGYIFPVQAHTVSAVAGVWNFLQSGYMPGDGMMHALGKLTLGADGTMSVCDYNLTDGSCQVDAEAPTQWAARSDGGFNLMDSTIQVPFYAYRAPNGSLNLFGTTNPDGINTNTTEQTSIVATKPRTLTLPEVGSISKYSELSQVRRFDSVNNVYVNLATAVSSDATTTQSVDSAAAAFTRLRESDGRIDTIMLNKPLDGLRSRPAGTSGSVSYSAVYQFPFNGLGITATINSVPAVAPTFATHLYALSVGRQ